MLVSNGKAVIFSTGSLCKVINSFLNLFAERFCAMICSLENAHRSGEQERQNKLYCTIAQRNKEN